MSKPEMYCSDCEAHYLACLNENCDFAPCVDRRITTVNIQALEAKLEVAIKALTQVNRHGLGHYEDCPNEAFEDEPCVCGAEETELIVREALAKLEGDDG